MLTEVDMFINAVDFYIIVTGSLLTSIVLSSHVFGILSQPNLLLLKLLEALRF